MNIQFGNAANLVSLVCQIFIPRILLWQRLQKLCSNLKTKKHSEKKKSILHRKVSHDERKNTLTHTISTCCLSLSSNDVEDDLETNFREVREYQLSGFLTAAVNDHLDTISLSSFADELCISC